MEDYRVGVSFTVRCLRGQCYKVSQEAMREGVDTYSTVTSNPRRRGFGTRAPLSQGQSTQVLYELHLP